MTKDFLAKYIDHTILKPNAAQKDIIELCSQAKEYSFASCCINPGFVKTAAQELSGSEVKVCTVIGFPLGANSLETKLFEAMNSIAMGASEIDMVINISALIDKDYKYLESEISALAELCKNNNALLKVIVETCLLNETQKIDITKIVSNSGADFIKTSTGFSTGGATLDDIELFAKYSSNNLKIKASGGIRDLEFALKLISAGAERLGTSSGIQIINSLD